MGYLIKWKFVVVIIIFILLLLQVHYLQSGERNIGSMSDSLRNNFPISPDNNYLVQHVRNSYMISPSGEPYNLTNETDNPSAGLVQQIQEYLLSIKNGIFIECGAHDGERHSNTLWLEKYHNWTGLLIEPDSQTFQKLKQKNRKSWLANVCLSSKWVPEQVDYYRNPNQTAWNSMNMKPGMGHRIENMVRVQCIPLETLLLAARLHSTIHFFSLDVEGYELEVLKGIPFERLTILIFVIEVFHIPGKGAGELHELMVKNNYHLHYNQTTTKDLTYFHKSFISKIERGFNS